MVLRVFLIICLLLLADAQKWPVTGDCQPCECFYKTTSFGRMRTVNCSKRGLSVLPNNIPPDVMALDLSWNSLSIAQLQRVCKLHSLQSLWLSYNDLTSLSTILAECSSVLELNLTGNRLKSIDVKTFQGLNNLKRLLGLEVESIASRDVFKQLKNLKDLDLIFHGEILPKGLFDGMVIQYLNLVLTKSTSLPKGVFEFGQRTLNTLQLTGESVTKLSENLLDGLYVLRKLYLTMPRVTQLSERFFNSQKQQVGAVRHAASLQEVEINGIGILPARLLNQLVNLETLILKKINSFPEVGFLTEVVNLRMLDITGSTLKRIPASWFRQQYSLKHLKLSGVQLEKLHENAFEGLMTLSYLDLSNNKLEKMTGRMLRPVSQSLETLIMSGNMLSEITADCLTGLRSLRFLDVSENRLSRIDEDSFMGLTYLSVVYLNNNKLTSLPNDLFKHQREVQTLSVADNYLSKFPTAILQLKMSLISLVLSSNELSTVPAAELCQYSYLEIVDLTDNYLHCDCKLLAFKDCPYVAVEGQCRTPKKFSNMYIDDVEVPESCKAMPDASGGELGKAEEEGHVGQITTPKTFSTGNILKTSSTQTLDEFTVRGLPKSSTDTSQVHIPTQVGDVEKDESSPLTPQIDNISSVSDISVADELHFGKTTATQTMVQESDPEERPEGAQGETVKPSSITTASGNATELSKTASQNQMSKGTFMNTSAVNSVNETQGNAQNGGNDSLTFGIPVQLKSKAASTTIQSPDTQDLKQEGTQISPSSNILQTTSTSKVAQNLITPRPVGKINKTDVQENQNSVPSPGPGGEKNKTLFQPTDETSPRFIEKNKTTGQNQEVSKPALEDRNPDQSEGKDEKVAEEASNDSTAAEDASSKTKEEPLVREEMITEKTDMAGDQEDLSKNISDIEKVEPDTEDSVSAGKKTTQEKEGAEDSARHKEDSSGNAKNVSGGEQEEPQKETGTKKDDWDFRKGGENDKSLEENELASTTGTVALDNLGEKKYQESDEKTETKKEEKFGDEQNMVTDVPSNAIEGTPVGMKDATTEMSIMQEDEPKTTSGEREQVPYDKIDKSGDQKSIIDDKKIVSVDMEDGLGSSQNKSSKDEFYDRMFVSRGENKTGSSETEVDKRLLELGENKNQSQYGEDVKQAEREQLAFNFIVSALGAVGLFCLGLVALCCIRRWQQRGSYILDHNDNDLEVDMMDFVALETELKKHSDDEENANVQK